MPLDRFDKSIKVKVHESISKDQSFRRSVEHRSQRKLVEKRLEVKKEARQRF